MANGSVAKTTAKPKGENPFARLGKFIREAYYETRVKSSWPTAAELKQLTIVVIVALVIVTTWIGGLDALFKAITSQIAGE